MSDSEKLTALAKETKHMRNCQRSYFKMSKDYRKGLVAHDELRKALTISKDHEERVDKLIEKVLNRQSEMQIEFDQMRTQFFS